MQGSKCGNGERIFLMFTLILGACRSFAIQPPLSLSILENSACSVSCWNNLKAGDSEDTVRGFYTATFTQYSEYNIGIYHFYRAVHKDGYTALSYTTSNELEGIFLASPLGFDFPIEKIIQRLGEPQYTFISYERSVETSDIFPYVMVYYPRDGYAFRVDLVVRSRASSQVVVCIEPSAIPSEIYVSKSGSIQEFVNTADFANPPRMDSNQLENYVSSLLAWSGYECAILPYESN